MYWYLLPCVLPFILNCECSMKLEVQHTLSCKKFGFVSIWSNKKWKIKQNQEIRTRKIGSNASTDVLNCYECKNQLTKKLKWVDVLGNGKFTIGKLILSMNNAIGFNSYVHCHWKHLTVKVSIFFISELCRVNFEKLENWVKEIYYKLLIIYYDIIT